MVKDLKGCGYGLTEVLSQLLFKNSRKSSIRVAGFLSDMRPEYLTRVWSVIVTPASSMSLVPCGGQNEGNTILDLRFSQRWLKHAIHWSVTQSLAVEFHRHMRDSAFCHPYFTARYSSCQKYKYAILKFFLETLKADKMCVLYVV
jgi:hypothetical protein